MAYLILVAVAAFIPSYFLWSRRDSTEGSSETVEPDGTTFPVHFRMPI
jgi:hypothetical protein